MREWKRVMGQVGKNGRIETARGTDVAAVIVLLLAVYIIHVRAGNISTSERDDSFDETSLPAPPHLSLFP